MRKRIKKPYIAAVFLAFFVLFSVSAHAYSGSALVDGKSYDVEKVYSYSNGVESATPLKFDAKEKIGVQLLYQIKMPEMTVKTPVATTCYWNKANEDRRCVQTVEIDNAGADLALKEAFGSSVPFKNLIINAPEVLKKGAYNVTYEFDYPANKGEEWNLTFATPTVAFLIDPTISACSVLNATGETYTLTTDLGTDGANTGNYDCFEINASQITFDCQGHSIKDNNTDLSGVSIITSGYSGPDYVNETTIKNCMFIMENSSWGAIDGTPIGINLYSDFNAIITNNTFQYNCTLENYLSTSCGDISINPNSYFNDTVFNNKINHYILGLETEFISISNWNITRQSGMRVFSNGTEIGGNYWTNSTANGYSDTCTDLLQDGFCDDPYDVEANAACAAVADGLPACGNNTDWLPLSAFYQEQQEPCVPSWNCTAWGECVRGYQSRTCVDDNGCQNETGKPAQSQACLKTIPNATFNVSGDCCPISTFYCTDNETLVQLWNTSDGVSWAVQTCEFGCDNVTDSCTPVPYAQNLWLLVIFAAIVVIGLAFIRWVR